MVDVANIDHSGALRIEVGAGNDAISAADVALAEVNVHVGNDGNTVTFARIDVSGSVVVEAGFNDLTDIEPNNYLVVDSTVGADLRMDLSVARLSHHEQHVDRAKRRDQKRFDMAIRGAVCGL